MTKEEAKSVAFTILQQLGGNRFMAMTGVKKLGWNDSGVLTFKFPRKKGLMYCRITLTSLDLYHMEFLDSKCVVKADHDMVYNDQLQSIRENNKMKRFQKEIPVKLGFLRQRRNNLDEQIRALEIAEKLFSRVAEIIIEKDHYCKKCGGELRIGDVS